jgi:peptidoglycan/LPS O-acetylase OafA/YrhL
MYANEAAEPSDRPAGHIPALDGLRGLAILMVLANHLGAGITFGHAALDSAIHRVVTDSNTGVDLFFVLSGFLITGILLDTRRRQGALPVFFARRSLRIFPLYYCVLIVIFFVAPIVEQLLGKQAPSLQHSTAWMWLYGFNFLIAKFNTFDLGPVLSLLGPFWSLSVEEQFYLVLPLLIIKMPFRRIPWLLLSVVLTAVGLRWYWITHFPPPQIATYVLLPFRMDSLAIGGLVAWIWRRFPGVSAVRQMAGYLSAGAGILALYGVTSEWPTNSVVDFGFWRLSILVFLWGALILRVVSSSDTSWANRLLSVAWLRMFGRYSYGIYVYHFVIIALLVPPLERIVSDRVHSQLISLLLAKGLALAVALTVAVISWHVIEQPFLSLKRFFKAPKGAGVPTSMAYPAARAAQPPDGVEPTN